MDALLVTKTLIAGIGATLVMDTWSQFQKRILKIPPLNYALVGRWMLWCLKGKFVHHTIMTTPRVWGEIVSGWVFHYLTGILFACIPLAISGKDWFGQAPLLAGTVTGILTMMAPFFILQPAFGFGLAASRTPRPWLARLMTFLTHLSFGIGLCKASQLLIPLLFENS